MLILSANPGPNALSAKLYPIAKDQSAMITRFLLFQRATLFPARVPPNAVTVDACVTEN